MINPKDFYEILQKKGIDFFTGVPDSLLKDFCAYVEDNTPKEKHIITANEGGAIALASGYHLATGKIPLVYMQNSGLGNAINPLTSLADKKVYSFPMILLVGWRGHPLEEDEPQHKKMGEVTTWTLKTLETPYNVIKESSDFEKIINESINTAKKQNTPYTLVIRQGAFSKYKSKRGIEGKVHELTRENALKTVVDSLSDKDIIISTTGKLSRELYEFRDETKKGHEKDFLTVGSMGHSSMIALGIALSKPDRNVYCFDGDGASIMHLGNMATIGQRKPKNFKHIIFNNGCHESVGGQPTAGFDIDFLKIADGCGYKKVGRAKTAEELKEKIVKLKSFEGPSMLEIRINSNSRENLGRPKTTPIQNKKEFMKNLKTSKN